LPAAEANDVTGVYNVLYSYLFDRHRDMVLPVSFLIDEAGEIVKVYQGRVEPVRVEEDARGIPRTPGARLARGLPLAGVAETYEFHRNYLSLGSVYFERGFYEQSQAAFQLVLRDDPSSAEAEYGLGSCYLKLEKTGEARACFERAVKLSAGYLGTLPNAWNNLGLLAAREGRTGDAIGYFKKALALDGDHWVALQNLGNAYRVQKNWEEARAALEHALAVRSEDPETNYSLAMVFAQTGHEDAAHEYLRRALKYRPDYPEALNNLGVLYLRAGQRDDAVEKFQECIRVAPAFDQSYLNLARVYSLEGAPQKARAVLLDLLKQRPGHAQAQQMLEELH
jgi:tetratricopeptide (TPR) repeat protein